jgi:O-antigen/teichoic acid export membrane protein
MPSSFTLLKKLARQSFIYGLSGVLGRFLYIFLVPVYTRIFVPADYGIIAIVSNLSSLLNILVILGLDNSVGRWYYENEDTEDRKLTLNSYLWGCCITASTLGLVLLISNHYIAYNLFKNPGAAQCLMIIAAILPLSVFQSFTWNILRVQHRATMTMIFTLGISLFNIFISILFVVGFRLGVIGVFYAQLVSAIAATVWTLILFKKIISPRYLNWERWKEMFTFSFPLIPGSIAFWVVNLSGAYFIQLMKNSAQVGLYQVGSTIAASVAILTGAFQMAWGPFAYSIHKQENAKQIYAHTFQIFTGITCMLTLFITLFSKEILSIFTNEKYLDASLVAAILSYNYLLVGFTYIGSIGTGLAKNNKAYGVGSVIAALLFVTFNFWLVPLYGKEGAAISVVLSQLLVPIIIFWHAQKIYYIPYNFVKATGLVLLSLLIGFPVIFISAKLQLQTPLLYIIKATAMIIFFFIAGLVMYREFKKDKAQVPLPLL